MPLPVKIGYWAACSAIVLLIAVRGCILNGGSWDNAKPVVMRNPVTGAQVYCTNVGLDGPPPTKADVAKFDTCIAESEAAGFLKDESR